MTGEEAGSGKEEGVGIRTDRKKTRSVIRLEWKTIRAELWPTWKNKGAGANRLGPIQERAEAAEIVRSNPYQLSTITRESRPNQNPIGQD